MSGTFHPRRAVLALSTAREHSRRWRGPALPPPNRQRRRHGSHPRALSCKVKTISSADRRDGRSAAVATTSGEGRESSTSTRPCRGGVDVIESGHYLATTRGRSRDGAGRACDGGARRVSGGVPSGAESARRRSEGEMCGRTRAAVRRPTCGAKALRGRREVRARRTEVRLTLRLGARATGACQPQRRVGRQPRARIV